MLTTKRKPVTVAEMLTEEFLSPLKLTQTLLARSMGALGCRYSGCQRTGQATLSDVERRHDLDAARDRVLELERRRHLLGEHAVDAIANSQLFLVWLDMDIACALLDGVEQHHIHETNDRSVLARFLEFEQIDVFVIAGKTNFGFIKTGHHLVI